MTAPIPLSSIAIPMASLALFNATIVAIFAREGLLHKRHRGSSLAMVLFLTVALTLGETLLYGIIKDFLLPVALAAGGILFVACWALFVARVATGGGGFWRGCKQVAAASANALSVLHRRKKRLQGEIVATEVQLAQLKADPYYMAAMGEVERFLDPYKKMIPLAPGEIPIAALAEAKARATQLLLERDHELLGVAQNPSKKPWHIWAS